MITANIGGDKFTKIKETWRYFYVFEALRVSPNQDNPNNPVQMQRYHIRPIQNKIEADAFARNPKVANFVTAKLIHDPVRYRAEEKREAARLREEVKAVEEVVKAAPKKVVKRKTK